MIDTYTVFGKALEVYDDSVADEAKRKRRAGDLFQSYLKKTLALPDDEAYAIMCLVFGFRHTCDSIPDLPFNKIYLVAMALPDKIEL